MNNKNKKDNKKPTFNLSWIYILLFVAFGYIIMKDDGSSMVGKANYSEFKEYVEKGYAEKDPTADIEGYDAGRKIAIYLSGFCQVHIWR